MSLWLNLGTNKAVVDDTFASPLSIRLLFSKDPPITAKAADTDYDACRPKISLLYAAFYQESA